MDDEKEVLSKYFNGRFCRHQYEIKLCGLFKKYRNSYCTNPIDELITQAVLEISSNIKSYGPIEIIKRKINNSEEMITVRYDGLYVFIAEKSLNEVIIIYIRDNNIGWKNDICKLASAHYDLFISNEKE